MILGIVLILCRFLYVIAFILKGNTLITDRKSKLKHELVINLLDIPFA